MAAGRKDHPENSGAGQEAKRNAEHADAAVSGPVDEAIDRETQQGFRGVEVDPTPNENYTLAGVTSGAPTPETSSDAAAAAREGQQAAEAKADGVSRQ